MRLPNQRRLFLILIFVLILVVEIVVVVQWQQRSTYHVVFISIALGAILAPSLYLMFILDRKCWTDSEEASSKSWKHISISFFNQVIVLVIFSVLGVVIAAVIMSASSAWCCVRDGRRLQLCDLAAAVAKAFNQNGIDYYVTFGTLLGFARSQKESMEEKEEEEERKGKRGGVRASSLKDGGMIPWEHDMDIAIAEKQIEISYRLLQDRGFNLERRSSTGVVAYRIHLPGASVWGSAWSMNWIDVYPYIVEKRSGEIISRNMRNYMGTKIMLSDVKPYRSISFCGFNYFSAPRLPIRHVKGQYGAQWRKPHFPDDSYKGTTCKIFKDC